jgi:hypothetical protein
MHTPFDIKELSSTHLYMATGGGGGGLPQPPPPIFWNLLGGILFDVPPHPRFWGTPPLKLTPRPCLSRLLSDEAHEQQN